MPFSCIGAIIVVFVVVAARCGDSQRWFRDVLGTAVIEAGLVGFVVKQDWAIKADMVVDFDSVATAAFVNALLFSNATMFASLRQILRSSV